MLLSTLLPTRVHQAAFWLAQHPQVAQALSLALLFAIALITALLMHQPIASACSPTGSSCGIG